MKNAGAGGVCLRVDCVRIVSLGAVKESLPVTNLSRCVVSSHAIFEGRVQLRVAHLP